MKEEHETYLVLPDIASQIPEMVSLVDIRLAVTRQGAHFLWPIKVPDGASRSNTWNMSKLAAADLAEKQWIRMVANMSIQSYDIYTAKAEFMEPVWPEKPMKELLNIAFGESNVIRDSNHPVVRQLLGYE